MLKIGITGATGQLGRIVVAKLKEKIGSDGIVALVRSTPKGVELGIECREFDYDRQENLVNALQGLDNLLLISGNELGKRALQHGNVIEAAKKAKVRWIVYTSLLHADQSSLSLAPEHLATETQLKQSGIPYTILRNGWYTENYIGSVQGALAGGAFIGSAGEGRISSAARADFAEAAVAVLTGEGHLGKTYELAGDDSFSLTELASEISKQSGKDIPYKNLPESDYAAILKSFGLPVLFADAIASWDIGASKGDLLNKGHQLSELIGRPTTPLKQSVSETLGSL